uniref:Uncharacterized protein n=1 Tax=Phenylobacterium glaciei TaxID=2803784 RepID=A0A974P1U4_9CAUL|nr:hypothetical protein JKL49_20830 [Phenylobacterium glaciei]
MMRARRSTWCCSTSSQGWGPSRRCLPRPSPRTPCSASTATSSWPPSYWPPG